MRFHIFENYDHRKPIGFIELTEDIPHEILSNCVIAPEIKIGVEDEVVSYGMFPKESLDPRSKAETIEARSHV